ncbi:MAG TPA: hypothetical protein VK157_06505 [Phycisphaerales bacterium]|nr:hypothetical protein [Phycisphaerales bacterium]
MRIYLLVVLAAVCLGASGCASQFSGTTTYFYANDPPAPPLKVAVVPYDHQTEALDWEVYSEQLQTQLTRVGFQAVDAKAADYLVTLSYSIDGQGETRTQAIPQYDASGQMTGVVNRSSVVHQRALTVRFLRKGDRVDLKTRPAVEIRVLSAGSSNELAEVMPVLAKGAFHKWPGKEGQAYEWTISQ